jgi:hypothetical protein
VVARFACPDQLESYAKGRVRVWDRPKVFRITEQGVKLTTSTRKTVRVKEDKDEWLL